MSCGWSELTHPASPLPSHCSSACQTRTTNSTPKASPSAVHCFSAALKPARPPARGALTARTHDCLLLLRHYVAHHRNHHCSLTVRSTHTRLSTPPHTLRCPPSGPPLQPNSAHTGLRQHAHQPSASSATKGYQFRPFSYRITGRGTAVFVY